MKKAIVVCGLFLCVVMLSGCDDKKDGFSGLSDMVGQRNEARRLITDENVRKNSLENQEANTGNKDDAIERIKTTEVSPVVVYERDIEVVDSSSRMALAKGVAYLNKEGQIVKIKIVKE